MDVATNTVDDEEDDNKGCDDAAGDEHRALLGEFLFLGFVLGVSDG